MYLVTHETLEDFYCSAFYIPQTVDPANFSVIWRNGATGLYSCIGKLFLNTV